MSQRCRGQAEGVPDLGSRGIEIPAPHGDQAGVVSWSEGSGQGLRHAGGQRDKEERGSGGP